MIDVRSNIDLLNKTVQAVAVAQMKMCVYSDHV